MRTVGSSSKGDDNACEASRVTQWGWRDKIREIISPWRTRRWKRRIANSGELYKRLALVRPLSRERIRLQMQIARVRKRIAELERDR
jgi:hypothetical protein